MLSCRKTIIMGKGKRRRNERDADDEEELEEEDRGGEGEGDDGHVTARHLIASTSTSTSTLTSTSLLSSSLTKEENNSKKRSIVSVTVVAACCSIRAAVSSSPAHDDNEEQHRVEVFELQPSPSAAVRGLCIIEAMCSDSGNDSNRRRLIVASGGDDKRVTLWEVIYDKEKKSHQQRLLAQRSIVKRVSALAFTPDGSYIVAADKFGEVHVASMAKLNQQEGCDFTFTLLLGHYCSIVTQLAFSHDGRYLCSGGKEEKVRVSRFPPCESSATPMDGAHEIQSFCFGHTSFITSIATMTIGMDSITGASQFIVTGAGDGTIRLWDLLSGKQLDMLYVASDKSGTSEDEANAHSKDGTVTCMALKGGSGIAAIDLCSDLLTFSCIVQRNVNGNDDDGLPTLRKGKCIPVPPTFANNVTSMSYDAQDDMLWLSAGLGDSAGTHVLNASLRGRATFDDLVLEALPCEYTGLQGDDAVKPQHHATDNGKKMDMYAELRKKVNGNAESIEARKKDRRDVALMNKPS